MFNCICFINAMLCILIYVLFLTKIENIANRVYVVQLKGVKQRRVQLKPTSKPRLFNRRFKESQQYLLLGLPGSRKIH